MHIKVVVVEGNGRSLVGKTTAERMGLSRVGPGAYAISDGDIQAQIPALFSDTGKLKDVELHLHIDDSVRPVAQRMRRIPFTFGRRSMRRLTSC